MAHRFGTIPKASTTARGYGAGHMKSRKRYLDQHHPSDPCVLCGRPLGPAGRNLHLDHCPSCKGLGCGSCGDGYRGLAHGGCNRRDGAQRGNRGANAQQRVTRLRW